MVSRIFCGIILGILSVSINSGLAQEVIVSTSRTEYKKGQNIEVVMMNNLPVNIFSHAASTTPVFSIGNLEKKNPGGSWKRLFAQCQYPNCVYDIDAPGQIKPGESAAFVWEPLIYINGGAKYIPAGPGTYRLDMFYQVEGDPSPEKWDWKVKKSNEFIIRPDV